LSKSAKNCNYHLKASLHSTHSRASGIAVNILRLSEGFFPIALLNAQHLFEIKVWPKNIILKPHPRKYAETVYFYYTP